MSRHSGRGPRPGPKPNRFNPSDGAKLPDCSQASGWDSRAQVTEDYYSLARYINVSELWGSSYEAADEVYQRLQPVVAQTCPHLLDALKRIYCSRKNK